MARDRPTTHGTRTRTRPRDKHYESTVRSERP